MARLTVEDCIDKIKNRFELILLASHRARQISGGSKISVERDNDKNPVVALREIADKRIAPNDLKEDLIHSLQKHAEIDEPEFDRAYAEEQFAKTQKTKTKPKAENKKTIIEESNSRFDALSEKEMRAKLEELKPQEPAEGL